MPGVVALFRWVELMSTDEAQLLGRFLTVAGVVFFLIYFRLVSARLG